MVTPNLTKLPNGETAMTVTEDSGLVDIASLSKLYSHTRFLLTLRSAEGIYKSLLLFRLSNDVPGQAANERKTDEIYVMEAECPHLGADMSHADIEDSEDGMVAVCPWHRYDFDLKTGKSEMGIKACVYGVHLREETVWINPPDEGSGWRLVEFRPVSEDFSDPPPASACAGTHSLQEGQSSGINLTSLPEPIVPSTNTPKTLIAWAVLILNTAHPQLKVERTRHAVSLFRAGKLTVIGKGVKEEEKPPDVPPREKRMMFVDPSRANKKKSRGAMLHALANIEQWAIDLAWDIIARFGSSSSSHSHPPLPLQFFSDFTKIALDEAKHFSLLVSRLSSPLISTPYGSLPIHAGLWDSAQQTSQTLLSRLAIIHLVHEARGLDVNPATIARFERLGDKDTVDILKIIHADEITHVMGAHRWFTYLCEHNSEDPVETFRREVKMHFSGALKGPFNEGDRERAGLSPDFYVDLRGERDEGEGLGRSVKPVHATEEPQVKVGI